MSPERHQRVRELFDGALEKPEDERLTYLRSVCPDDPDILGAVLRLLKAHAQSDSPFEQGARPVQRIGRYFVTGELGRGAMGIVYEAIDPVINRKIAIKVIRLQGITDATEAKVMRERLFHEARTAGALQHPGIVAVFDVGQEGETAYIAMELVEGPSLQQLLASGWKPDPGEALDLLRQTAVALDYAHQSGVVHRDVKPANIMMHKGVTVKVGDFGIAKIASSRQFTNTGMLMGTPSYMSPEQIEGRPVDGRSDQFALAAVGYEILTGTRPFQAESLAGLAHSIVYGTRPSARAASANLPAAVDAVLRRGLAVPPRDRYPSCLELVEALDLALTKGKVAQTRRLRISRGYLAAAGAIVGLALVLPLYKTLKPAPGSAPAVQQVLRPNLPETSGPAPSSIVAEGDCVNPRFAGPHGRIRILSGTGVFDHISESNKSVAAAPGERLQGTLTMRVSNGGPAYAYAPLIGTVSWGNHSTGYWQAMASIMPGEYTFPTSLPTKVPVVAPAQAGTYHILFAFDLEYEASNVASATDWVLHHDVWDDGNDIAQFSPLQIEQAQNFGCTIDQWLEVNERYHPHIVPADAITVQVR
jgi:serine/threonine protein kinase